MGISNQPTAAPGGDWFYRDVTRASLMGSTEKWALGAGSEGGRARAGIEPISLRYASGRA